MSEVIFYGLADCPANSKQKQQLKAAGHTLVERDLAAEPLTAETLRPFFGDRPVEEWFNRRAAAVKAGDVKPAELDEGTALAALLSDRDLIRRPLIQVGEERRSGFDPNGLHAWIGMSPNEESCDSKHSRGVCDHGHHHFPKQG